MKTYSASYIEGGSKVFEKINGSELYGKLPPGSRIVNRQVKHLEEVGAAYQCFATRAGPMIVVVEDKITN